MILQQNYIKILQTTQNAFKLYCRRALGGAIIRCLQKKARKQKQRQVEDEEVLMSYPQKPTSQRSIVYLQGLKEESIEADSALSQIKRTHNNNSVNGQKEPKTEIVIDRLQIMYGDLVYIEFNSMEIANTMRAKYFLNKLRFCKIGDIGVGSCSDLRCVFQIVYPGSSIDNEKKGVVVTQSSLVCFRTISKKQYLKVKKNKIIYSDQFGKQFQLSNQLNEGCVFQLKYAQKQGKQKQIISGTSIIIKMFGEELYMNLLQGQDQVFFSQSPLQFNLKKVVKKAETFVPIYYKLKSNKFEANILGNSIDLQTISQKKTVTNVVAINQSNDESKINPITFIQYDFTKIPQQDIKLQFSKDGSINNVYNCWELIQQSLQSENTCSNLYNPVIGLGLTVKTLKNQIKLTPNKQQFSMLKLTHYDEDVISFGLEQAMQQLDVIYDRTAQKYAIVLSKAETQNQSKKLKIKQIDTKICYMICEMTQVLDVLKGVYQFLNTWGIELNEKSQTVYYSVKQIKLGSSIMLKKVKQMRMVTKILKNYLQNPQYSVQDVQNTINSMKILEMIISICKIITNKIGYAYPYNQKSHQDPFYFESPFCFAKNNLEQIMKSMFLIILKLTKDNFPNSNSVISQVAFFNIILIYYPEQIGQILQQSIKNLSVFTSKSNSSQSNQLFLWIKLIQPVRQDIIRIQKTYIDIIAEVVVDPNDNGIPLYQNRCKQLLFIQNAKKKGIPKFGVESESHKPIIIFESESTMKDFFQRNQHLSKLNLVHLNSVSYFIQEFYADRYCPQIQISQQYLSYIGSVIKMFRNLCRNRNKKLFKIVDDWGINSEHIQSIFDSKKISWVLKSKYLSLWSVIYIDEDPFLPFEKRQSKCHYWPKIQKYHLQDCTALIFKQYTDQGLVTLKLNESLTKIYPVISSFFQYFRKKLPNVLSDADNLKSFLVVLKTVYEIMNLGYMTLKAIKYYIGIILHSLSGLEDGMFYRKSNEQQILKLHHGIITSFIEILILYQDMWVEVYGIQFLQSFYKQSYNKNYNFSIQFMETKWQDIIKNKFEQSQQNYKSSIKQPLNRKRTRFNAYSETDTTVLAGTATDCFNFQNLLNFQETDNQILDFSINLLVKRILQHKCQSYQKLILLINKKKARSQRICSYLKQIIILNNQKQQEIYRNFSGRQSNKLLNWLKIQELVLKISDIEANSSLDEVQQRCKKQKILQLNNILVKIIRQMRNYHKQNLQLLRKCQMVLEKLSVHKILLDILKYSEKQSYRELIKTVLQFYKQFMAKNEYNCKKLVPHIDKFTKNLNFEGLVYILPVLIKMSDKKQLSYKIAHQLIYKISQSQTNVYLLMIVDELLKLDTSSPENQQLRMHLSRQIIEQYNLNSILKEQLENQPEQSKILQSFQFTKILCRLSTDCPQLEREIKRVHTKCGLLEKLKNCQNYSHKKLYLKLLTQIYIRNKQLENFEIEDYFEILVLKQMKKLPTICMKLIQKKSSNLKRQIEIHALYEQLLSYSHKKIQTKDQEIYLNYILDVSDIEEVSILNFCKAIIPKWKGSQKSQRLTHFKAYVQKLQQFMFLVFYEQSSIYHRNIFQEIENVCLKLNNITVQNQIIAKNQRKITEQQKQEIIKFYHDLSSIIVEQKISVYLLFSCFKVDPKKFYMRRSNFSISCMVYQAQFMNCIGKLLQHVKKQNELKMVIQGVNTFRFINLSKDPKTKTIDLYFFMDKLIALMEYNKNQIIKQQTAKMLNLVDEQQKKNEKTEKLADLNTYEQNQDANQKQFSLQVETFCRVSQKFNCKISQSIDKKIKDAISSLSKKIITQWINGNGLDVFSISQHFNSKFLYTFVLSLVEKYLSIINDSSSNQIFIKNLNEYLKLMSLRFNQQLDSNLLTLFAQILTKFSTNKSVLQKIQRCTQKAYDNTISTTLQHKTQQNLTCLNKLNQLFTTLLNKPLTSNIFKIRMKQKTVLTIKKMINREIDITCSYDYQVMENLLLMWSENDLGEQVQNGALINDGEFICWVQKLFLGRSIRGIVGASLNNIIKCKFAKLLLKIFIKYQQTCPNQTLVFKKCLSKMQTVANSLFKDFVLPRKQAYTRQQYCHGYMECSQFFCNNERLTEHDENVLNFILSIFIITRIYLGKSEQKYQEMSQDKQDDNKIKQMIGSIKYRLYNREKNYNFKLPNYHIFTNKDIERRIIQQISKIQNPNIYLFFHALSKLFYKQLSLMSSLNRSFPPLQFIIANKNIIQKVLLVILVILCVLSLTTSLFSMDSSQQTSHPVIKGVCILAILFKLVYLTHEIRYFINKCNDYYPFKYALLSEVNNREYANLPQPPTNCDEKQKQKRGNSTKQSQTKKQINEIAGTQVSSCQNICYDKGQVQVQAPALKLKPLTKRQILSQLASSFIFMYIIYLLVLSIAIKEDIFLIFVLIMQALSLQEIRSLLRTVYLAIKQCLSFFFISTIVGLFCLIFYASSLQNDGHTFSTIYPSYLIIYYEIIELGQFSHIENSWRLKTIFIISGIVLLISSINLVFYLSNNIYKSKKQQQRQHNKCWVCLLSKQELQKMGQNFEYHLNNEHKIWDYLFFFVEFDRKGKLEGLELQIEEQINKRQYKFLRFY